MNNVVFISDGAIVGISLCSGVLLVIAVIVIIMRLRKNKRIHERQKNLNFDWQNYLGGKDNIISSSSNKSRLVLELKDCDKINKEELKSHGVKSIIVSSNNKVTLVFDIDTEEIQKSL